MASYPELQEFIEKAAQESARIPANTLEAQAVLLAFAGSLYALLRAFELGYEAPAEKSLVDPDDLRDLFTRIATDKPPSDGQWRAGFYFNSALHRLAAVYHRSLKLLLQILTDSRCEASCLADIAISLGRFEEREIKNIQSVSAKVNKIKHEPIGVLKRTVSPDVTVRAAKEALELLKLALREQQTP